MTTARIAIDGARKAPARTAAKAATGKASAATIPAGAAAPTVGEFSDLYNEYFAKVFAYVYGRVQDRESSLDIVSDVFEKAFVKVKSLRSRDSFGSWLFTIARNEVSSHWRKEKPAQKAAREAAIEKELHSQPKSPEELLVHKERLAALSALVRGLPKREQEIIALKFDAELTNREIASVLSTSEVNVRVTIFRALRKLRDRMKNVGDSLG
ncbi:MAG TPA: sigma-70 family RNA polymerase sigma factor [Dehalococcoidia bacterium]